MRDLDVHLFRTATEGVGSVRQWGPHRRGYERPDRRGTRGRGHPTCPPFGATLAAGPRLAAGARRSTRRSTRRSCHLPTGVARGRTAGLRISRTNLSTAVRRGERRPTERGTARKRRASELEIAPTGLRLGLVLRGLASGQIQCRAEISRGRAGLDRRLTTLELDRLAARADRFGASRGFRASRGPRARPTWPSRRPAPASGPRQRA